MSSNNNDVKLSFRAIIGIFNSRKGFMSLLILAISTVALFMRILDSNAFAAVVSVVGTIFMWTHTRTDTTAISASMYYPRSPINGPGDGIAGSLDTTAIKK